MYSRLLPLLAALVLTLPAAYSAEYDIFAGDYEGRYRSPDGDAKHDRDVSVSISIIKGGFNITWVTTTHEANDSKPKKYSIDFLETDREHIYQAAQKKNVFGGRVPLDPLKGEPYAWTRIKGRTLTTFVLTITDNGGYEIQTFDRTVTTDNDLELRFSRVMDGEVIRDINVTLDRVDAVRQEPDR